MDDTELAKLPTGSRVFLEGSVVILDAMEDVDLNFEI